MHNSSRWTPSNQIRMYEGFSNLGLFGSQTQTKLTKGNPRKSSKYTIGALITTYTIVEVPYSSDSIIYPKNLF